MTAYLDETGLAELWAKIDQRASLNELMPANAGAHNSVYRGKNITSKFNDGSLFTSISSGTFDDVFVGDYFTCSCKGVSGVVDTTDPDNPVVTASATAASNTTFLIAHLDKDYNKGDTALNKHHAVVIPQVSLGTAPMNATNTTDGGYIGSAMYTTVLPIVKQNLFDAFGQAHIIKRRAYLSNAQSNGYASGGDWYDSYVELMSENEVYGSRMRSNTNNVSELYNTGIDYGQLAIFTLAPQTITTRQWYWLRAVCTTWCFCNVYYYGYAANHYASGVERVRPRFLIG